MNIAIQALTAVAAAFAGGALFSLLGFPVAWLVGAMLGMALYSQFASNPFQPPRGYRRFGEWVLGASAGAGLKLQIVDFLIEGGVPIAITILLTIGLGIASGLLLKRLSSLSPITCYYASVPGGAAEMVALADGAGGDARLVASLHALRVGLIVASLPLALSPLAQPVAKVPLAGIGTPSDLLGMAMLLAAGGIGGLLAHRFHLPGGVILGSIAGAALVSVTGLTGGAALPSIFKNTGQAIIGAYAGAAFTRQTWKQVTKVLTPALIMIVFMVAVGLLTGVLLHYMTGIDWITALLATVPAGSAEMITAAAALGANVGMVAAIQVLRVIAMNLIFPILIPRLLSRTT